MNNRITATVAAVALAGLAAQPMAQASDREWAVAGKVLTGIAGVHILSHILDPGPRVVYQTAPVPVVYQTVGPAPVAPPAPVYAPAPYQVAPTTAVAYQPTPQVVYVATPQPYYVSRGPVVVVHPFGHPFRPRHCFARW